MKDKLIKKLKEKPELLKEIRNKIKKRATLKDPDPTFKELLSDYKHELKLYSNFLNKIGKKLKSFFPSDNKSKDDVAFGLLNNNRFIAAVDFSDIEIDLGDVSHSLMLVGLGYSEHYDDPNPKHDYIVRGIVKKNMDNAVAFWEDSEDLLTNKRYISGVKKCLNELLKRKLITYDSEVYGTGYGKSIATVKSYLKAK